MPLPKQRTVTKLGSKVIVTTFGVLASVSPDIIFQELKKERSLAALLTAEDE